jgi:RNA polymerase sigma-70 factor (ECF subfamily)
MSDRLQDTSGIDDLVARARAGDRDAENALFERVHARIVAVAKKRIWDQEAARDVAQETLRTVFEKYRDADMTHGFFPWLFTILHHKAGNYMKRRRVEERRAVHEGLWPARWEALAVGPDAAIAVLELEAALAKGLSQAGTECRRIFELLLAGAGRREIAAAFAGEPMGTIDSRISRCRARLLAYLEAQARGGGSR